MKTIEIRKQLDEIKNLLSKGDKKLLNFDEAAKYLSISHSHLYKLTSKRKITFHKPQGKVLYFFKSELDEWIINNSKLKMNNEKLKTDMNEGQENEDNETDPP